MVDQHSQPDSQAPFETHALYKTAMQRLADGDLEGAAAKLHRLTRLFPRDRALQDLLVRIELRSTLGWPAGSAPPRSQPTPILRRAVLLLLTLTVSLVIIVGFVSAYNRYVRGNRGPQVRELHQSLQQGIAAGDWNHVREVSSEILTQVPGEPTALAALDLSSRAEELDSLYADAVAAEQQGNWQQAIDLLQQVAAQSPGFRDVRQRIERLTTQQTMETAWLKAQALAQAGDVPGVIALLNQIRATDPNFRRSQVEEQLFQAYTYLARLQIDSAGGNLDSLREAVAYLDQALALRPTNQDLAQQREMAAAYVAGAEAYDAEDWVEAVENWEPIFRAYPDYQNGALHEPLRQAYPRAARQLIDEANGSLPKLRQAITYLDQALRTQPDNQELIETRRQASEYVAGANAYNQHLWTEAINRWGPLYATRPNYQNGVLEQNLRHACGQAPNASLCPPQ